MYLQGNLQTVFDALYQLGAIQPVLKSDWSVYLADLPQYRYVFAAFLQEVNANQSNPQQLAKVLQQYDDRLVKLLAMEVAREYADFQSRENLH